MLQSRRFRRRSHRQRLRVSAVPATIPSPPAAHSKLRGLIVATVLIAYAAVIVAAYATGRAWLDELAALMLVTLLLSPGLRRRSVAAWIVWLIAVGGLAFLALTDRGALAIDFMPIMVNAALCTLFARTLAPGSTPLVARVIGVLEGPERLALPGVTDYARRLTFAWAALLGMQAIVLLTLVACAVPDGLIASFGAEPPFAIAGTGWRWYLHLGSYATVLAFIVIEYAYRRWHLRHIPHASLPSFVARLARRWPALARSVMDDDLSRNGS